VVLGNVAISGFDFKSSRGMTVGYDGSIATFTDTTVATDDPVTPATPDPELTCYPNPFRGSITVKFSQIDNSPTTVSIYNTRGQLIRTLINSQKLSPGEHSFTWDGKTNSGQPTAAGIYYYKMSYGRYSSTKKMIMMK
jgi:flagellar hook assembly protein FlgD